MNGKENKKVKNSVLVIYFMRMARTGGEVWEKKEYKGNAGERNCTHSEGASWKEFTNDCRRTGRTVDEVRKIYEAVMA